MTKTDEIALLDKTITRFGADSYLGPWLAEMRAALVADILNDLPASAPMPTAARAEAALLLDAAKAQAADIVDTATRPATATRDAAQNYAREIRARARGTLERLIREVA